MADVPKRPSPIHHLLDSQCAEWEAVGDGALPARCGPLRSEQAAVERLGLCDLSGLPKLGVKGPAAGQWLREQGLDVPETTHQVGTLPQGGLLIRLPDNEFFLEDAITSATVPGLAARLAAGRQRVCLVQRHDAGFLLAGSLAGDVLAQTCSIDFRQVGPKTIAQTMLASVPSSVLRQTVVGTPAYRLWVDPSHAVYLWETLLTICEELGGQVVGFRCCFPKQ